LSVGPAAPAIASCPNGLVLDASSGECLPSTAADGLPGQSTAPVAPASPSETSGAITNSTPGDINSLPEIQGIPCTGANTGECIGLGELQQPPAVEPHSTLSSSP
jgi:hypothetical protein